MLVVLGIRYLVLAEDAIRARDKAVKRWPTIDFSFATVTNLLPGAREP
jgi:hypothetical protein